MRFQNDPRFGALQLEMRQNHVLAESLRLLNERRVATLADPRIAAALDAGATFIVHDNRTLDRLNRIAAHHYAQQYGVRLCLYRARDSLSNSRPGPRSTITPLSSRQQRYVDTHLTVQDTAGRAPHFAFAPGMRVFTTCNNALPKANARQCVSFGVANGTN